MALPKKGFRKIKVNDFTYVYKVTGSDYGINFLIGLPDVNGQLLTGNVSYNCNRVTNFNEIGTPESWNIFPRTIVTPKTIRQIILYGLANDWKPAENLQPLSIGNVDSEIDLELKPETKFPDLRGNEMVLTVAQISPYQRLNITMQPYDGYGNIYSKFDTEEKALIYARQLVKEKPELACWILCNADKATFYIDFNTIQKF